MKTAEKVIAESIHFDHRPTSNARRILESLREEGYELVDARYLHAARRGELPRFIDVLHGSRR